MNKSGFYISISMILLGILLWLLNIYPLGGGLILGGVLLLISNIYYTRKPKTETIIDERIKRINDKAGTVPLDNRFIPIYHSFFGSILMRYLR